MIANSNRILWLPGDDSRNWDYESGGWSGSNRNPSGVKIDAETALRSTVVLACIRVLSTSVAGLPLHLYRRLAGGGKEIAREHPLYKLLHTQPNSWQTSFEWREQMMLHLLTTGAAFDEKVYAGGSISEIVPLHPSRMKVEQIENMRLRYTYREASGSSTVYTQDAIMSVRGMSDDGVHGLSMIEMARDAIGLSRACEIHGASFFGNGARPGVVLSTDQMLSPEAAENTRNQWERAHRGADRAHKTAVLQGGLKVNELGGNNQEAQFLEARRFQVEEICRLWGVPPHLVGDLSRSSYSNIEQQSLDYVQNGLMPWLRRIESAIARDLLENDDEYFAEFDTRGSLRADAAGRATYYNTLWQLGVASVNEIRSWENMNPVEGGDTRFVQLNMTTLEKAAAEPEVPATVVEEIVVDETAPAPEPADAPTVIEVIDQYRSGSLTLEGAKALLMVSFPQTPEAMIDAILAGVVMKEPEPVAEEPAPEPVAEPAPEQASQRAAPYVEGEWVTLPDGRVGRVDHVMTEGELNLGDVAMPATPDAPVALVSVWEGESFGEPVPVAVSELQTAEEPEAARAYGKPKRKPAKRAAQPSGRRLRRAWCPGASPPDNSCPPGNKGKGPGGSGKGKDSSASAGNDSVDTGGGGADGPAHVEGSRAFEQREANRNARKTEDYPPTRTDSADTDQRHTVTPRYSDDGRYIPPTSPDDWTPERRRMHEEVIADATANVPRSAEPTLYMMGGGPASGKSTITRSGAVKHPDKHVLANPDVFKEDVPEYRAGLAAKRETAAPEAHEESSYLNKRTMKVAAENGQDVVWDGTGDNSVSKLEEQVKVFRSKGYKIQADYVTCDTEVAVKRSQDAAKNPKSDRYGRNVPVDAIRETHARVSEIWPEAVSRGLFDRSDLYDTTSSGKPVLIARARGTAIDIQDKAAYQRFLDKAKRDKRSRRRR
jgi:HK97 family phage portal protein